MNMELYHFMHQIKHITRTPNYQSQKHYIQHGNCSVYKHAITVAFNSYKKAKLKKNYDVDAVIKGALLHDYFLYDWHYRWSHKGLHGFTHPYIALRNASSDYGVSKKEADIIKHHMWPLTIFHIPRSKEALLVSLIDKGCACHEMKRKKAKVKY